MPCDVHALAADAAPVGGGVYSTHWEHTLKIAERHCPELIELPKARPLIDVSVEE